jgi:hypothetical protein
VRALELPLGSISAHTSASFPVEERTNVMGEIAAGTVLLAAGPVAEGRDASGVGYAVLLRDSGGQVCRGYVSARVVEVISPTGGG